MQNIDNQFVIDIVDTHDVFNKQWIKRRKYYIKESYKIIHSSDKGSTWETMYDNVGASKKKKMRKYRKKENPLKGKCLINL